MKTRIKTCFLIVFMATITVLSNVVTESAANKSIYIPVTMATDNNYIEPTLVAIVSASENANPYTKLRFYIMVTDDFSDENKTMMQRLNEKLPNCEITLIGMGNAFKRFEGGHWGTAMYYRLKLASVLKNENKCIYLDGDTLVLRDLSDMYNLDLGENYVAGVPDGYRLFDDYASKLGITDMSQYICSGSLLWNLDQIRKDNIEEKFEQFLETALVEDKNLFFPDQDTINAVCYGKIMDMPFKYGAIVGFLYCPKYEKDPYLFRIIDKSDWEDSVKNTVVLHFVGKKPWISRRIKFNNLWHKYHSDLDKILS